MTLFVRNAAYTGPVQSVVLDWAGTAVDYGCMGPAAVFVDVFESFGIRVSSTEARRFMGIKKQDHIRRMCGLPNVIRQWREQYGKTPDENDIESLYRETEPMMIAAVRRHAEPVPGLADFIASLRKRRIKIGSCTGYTRPIMDALVPEARQRGYEPDAVVCSSDVPAGRPYPWMCYRNAILLETYPLEAMIKIGDTVADIEEGLNAGMWTIAVTQSGNELGLPLDEAAQLPPAELKQRLAAIEDRFRKAGAHYVATGIRECLPLIEAINQRLAHGEQPLPRPAGK